jgi:hypothetical protein
MAKILLYLLGISLFLSSCNIEKRVLKNEERFNNIGRKWLEKNPCINDSTVTYLPGEITILPVDEFVIDTISTQRAIDSISHLYKGCADQVSIAYKDGYNKAISECKVKLRAISIIKRTPDTIKIVVKDKQEVKLLTQDVIDLKKQLSDAKLQSSVNSNATTKWLLLFILACILLGFSLYLNVKK